MRYLIFQTAIWGICRYQVRMSQFLDESYFYGTNKTRRKQEGVIFTKEQILGSLQPATFFQ